ncbi:CHASE2 domain-containing protein [Variovorax sp. J31P216]|nr:CHASE2 domain-containing protein [Variovorax sp. J31P216]MDM0029182.1 CHASE2 domain-containing protein [Variovorax sp. J31P216]
MLGEEFLVRQIARAYAPLVGTLQGTARRDAISVLVIDDQSLQRAGQSWPADYGYYARLIDSLGANRPKAIFIDVMFAAKRNDPSIARLIDSACKASASGVRIYLATRRDADGRFLLRPDLEAVSPRCVHKVAVEYEPDQADQTAWSYRLGSGSGAHGSPLSAANAIYVDLGGALPATLHSDVALNWGLASASRGLEWLQSTAPDASHHGGHQDSPAAPTSYCREANGSAADLLPASIHRLFDPEAEKPVCVFHNTLYPADLATSSDEEDQELKAQVEGRVIMIGTALQGSNDRVISPLHGRIPGVYLHAMALDNLLFYGKDFKRATHASLNPDGLRVWFLVLVGLLIVGFARMVREKRAMRVAQASNDKPGADASTTKAPWKRKPREALLWIARKAASVSINLLFITGMLFIGQKLLNLGFLAVIDVALFAFAAEWLEWNESLWNWLTDTPAPAHHH